MSAAPLPRNSRSEKLWLEYDAYAKLENAITFLVTDLEVIEEYLQTSPGPLPATLVEQFADNMHDFQKEAEELQKNYGFSEGEALAQEIWNTVDSTTHKSLGRMIADRKFTKLGEALQKWTQENVCSSWKKKLEPLNSAVNKKMVPLLQEINKTS